MLPAVLPLVCCQCCAADAVLLMLCCRCCAATAVLLPAGDDAEGDDGYENEGGDDDDGLDDAAAAAAKAQAKHKGRGRQGGGSADEEATLTTPDHLRAKKGDATFAVDPLFHTMSALFDEGGAKGEDTGLAEGPGGVLGCWHRNVGRVRSSWLDRHTAAARCTGTLPRSLASRAKRPGPSSDPSNCTAAAPARPTCRPAAAQPQCVQRSTHYDRRTGCA